MCLLAVRNRGTAVLCSCTLHVVRGTSYGACLHVARIVTSFSSAIVFLRPQATLMSLLLRCLFFFFPAGCIEGAPFSSASLICRVGVW